MGQTFKQFAEGNAANLTVEISGAGGPDTQDIVRAGGVGSPAAVQAKASPQP